MSPQTRLKRLRDSTRCSKFNGLSVEHLGCLFVQEWAACPQRCRDRSAIEGIAYAQSPNIFNICWKSVGRTGVSAFAQQKSIIQCTIHGMGNRAPLNSAKRSYFAVSTRQQTTHQITQKWWFSAWFKHLQILKLLAICCGPCSPINKAMRYRTTSA